MRDPEIRSPRPTRMRLPAPIDRVAGRLTNRLIRVAPWRRIQIPTAEPIVSFTFDDVPDSALTVGARILEKHGLLGTFYISCGLLDRVEPDRTLIGEAGCKALAAGGHEIGCHTYSHPDIRHVDRSFLVEDLAHNERCLNAIAPQAGKRNFAFPYSSGSFDKRALLGEAFRTCRAAGEEINRGATDPTFLRAVGTWQPDLAHWIDDLVASPGWLIFVAHDISPTPTLYGCTTSTFDQLVRYTVKRGCQVLTVDAALDRMRLCERVR